MRLPSCILPFICHSKPPRRHRESQRLDAEDVSSSTSPVSIVLEEKGGGDDGKGEVFLKGILKKKKRKAGGAGTVETGKGQVKWMDYLGKELVEIREFEPVSPPSPHLTGLESNNQHPHLRRLLPIPQQISSTPPYPAAALVSSMEPHIGSVINLQDLSICWNPPPVSMSSCNTHSSYRCSRNLLSVSAIPNSPKEDPLANSRPPPPMAPNSALEHSLGAPFIKPQHPPLAAHNPSSNPLSSRSFGGIQLQWYRPILQRISSAPSSNRTYLRRFHALPRSKSTGNMLQEAIGRRKIQDKK